MATELPYRIKVHNAKYYPQVFGMADRWNYFQTESFDEDGEETDVEETDVVCDTEAEARAYLLTRAIRRLAFYTDCIPHRDDRESLVRIAQITLDRIADVPLHNTDLSEGAEPLHHTDLPDVCGKFRYRIVAYKAPVAGFSMQVFSRAEWKTLCLEVGDAPFADESKVREFMALELIAHRDSAQRQLTESIRNMALTDSHRFRRGVADAQYHLDNLHLIPVVHL